MLEIAKTLGRRTCALLLFVTFFAVAQTPLPQAAQDALTKGQQAASAALATYDVHYLDKPLWRDAIEYGIAAQRAAPNRLEPYPSDLFSSIH